MKWVLKQMLSLAVALTVSTLAAGLIKSFRLYDARTARHYTPAAAAPAPVAEPRLRDTPVNIIYGPRPIRTDLAVRHGVAGTAKLSMTLHRDGTILITPEETPPDGLTYWAVKDAKEIKFRPAVAGGRFTDAQQMFEFRLGAATDNAVARSQYRLRNRSSLRQ